MTRDTHTPTPPVAASPNQAVIQRLASAMSPRASLHEKDQDAIRRSVNKLLDYVGVGHPAIPTPGPVPVTEGVVGRLREGWLRLYKDRYYWDGSPEHLAQIETDMGLLSGDMTAPLPPPVEPGPGLVVDADVIRRFHHVTSICHAQAQTINHLEAQLTFIRSQGTAIPLPPSAPGLDEFAAFVDGFDDDGGPDGAILVHRRSVKPIGDIGDFTWSSGAITMAEAVAQFRASRATDGDYSLCI